MVLPSISTVISLAVAYALLLALLRRPWTSGGITVYLVAFALLSSFIKQAYLGMAITLADMRFFLMRPWENFKLFLAYPLLGATLVAVVLGVTVCVLVGLKFERPMRLFSMPRVGAWLRAATAAAAALLGFGASLIASHETQARVNDGDAYAAFLSMYEQQHPGGLIGRLNVFFNNRSFAATIPPPREQHRFSSSPAAIPATATQRPDVLLVLEESTFDTTLIRDCPRVCDFEILHAQPTAVRTQQGPLLVHTTGGGTWLAEFAVVSGFDWRVFGRGGAFAPISLAPRLQLSLPKHFHDLGYRTIAVYPTDGNFLSAQTAYDHYGFEEFHERRALGLPDEWGDTRDAMVFAKALAAVQRRDDQRPVFLFVLTIRNHGPHGYHPETIPKKFAEAARRTSVPLADFLARMSDSSDDFAALAKQWLAADRPRVIAWFGDHQPEAAWDFTQHAEKLHLPRIAANVGSTQWQYLTRYQMSANYGISAVQESHDALDLAYLGGELLKFAGLPLDSGSLAAGEVAAICHGLFIDCADRNLINDYLSYRIHDLQAVD